MLLVNKSHGHVDNARAFTLSASNPVPKNKSDLRRILHRNVDQHVYLVISVSPSNPASDDNIFVFHNSKKSVFNALTKAS